MPGRRRKDGLRLRNGKRAAAATGLFHTPPFRAGTQTSRSRPNTSHHPVLSLMSFTVHLPAASAVRFLRSTVPR